MMDWKCVEKVLVLPHISQSRILVKMKGIVMCQVIQITVHIHSVLLAHICL